MMTTRRTELARARERAGLTQAEFGNELRATGLSPGVTEDTVSQWERGRCGIHAKHRRAIARVLGLATDEVARLIDGESPAVPSARTELSNGPGADVWTISVQNLPWRPCTAITGPYATRVAPP